MTGSTDLVKTGLNPSKVFSIDCFTVYSSKIVLHLGKLLQLTPSEDIVFRFEHGETIGSITLTNIADSNITYKAEYFHTCL